MSRIGFWARGVVAAGASLIGVVACSTNEPLPEASVVDVSGIWRVTGGSWGNDGWRDYHREFVIVGRELIMKHCVDRTYKDGSGRVLGAEGETSEMRATLDGRDFSFTLSANRYPMAGRIARDNQSITYWQENPNGSRFVWVYERNNNRKLMSPACR
jgi:hypothetical protein